MITYPYLFPDSTVPVRMRIYATSYINTLTCAYWRKLMMKYVKRSVFCFAVATAFFLGCPTTECVLWLFRKVWSLYGAYIRIWWEQHAAFFLPLCAVCVAVLLIYSIIFSYDPEFPFKNKSKEQTKTQLQKMAMYNPLCFQILVIFS